MLPEQDSLYKEFTLSAQYSLVTVAQASVPSALKGALGYIHSPRRQGEPGDLQLGSSQIILLELGHARLDH